MKKQTKVLLAAAALTLGASFTSMAALSNGTWVMNDEGWQYADKDGEYVEEEWCKSNGIEFWINEDEVLGSSEWVTDSEHTYYAQSDGSKTISAWKYLYAIDDEDEENDQNWYWFDAKGRMVKSAKKTIGDYTYYFDKDGKMLTGWVDVNEFEAAEKTDAVTDLVYTNEDGQLVKSSWLHVFPWTKDADDCYEGEHEEYYWAKADGVIANGKTTIEDLTYFFNNTSGIMLDGWVVKGYGEKDVYTSADAKIGLDSASVKEAYWTDEAGYAKKNSWREAENPVDEETYWYHFDKLGRAFLATDANTTISASAYTFNDGESLEKQFDNEEPIKVNSKKINGTEYFFTTAGEMIDGLQMIGTELYYLDEGAKATGKVTLTDENENDYTFYFGEKNDTDAGIKKYVAVTAIYKNYAYINGQLITSDDSDSYRLVTIGDKKYVVDNNGKVQHKDGEDYGLNLGELKFHDTDDYILTK